MSDKDALMVNYMVCKTTRFVCAEMLLAVSDTNNSVNNMARMPVAMAHFPSGSSIKNVIHFQQFIRSGEFKNYDYGERKNLQIYKQKTPPLYDLSKITTPVHLYVGKYDKLADVADAETLFKELTNSEGKVEVCLI